MEILGVGPLEFVFILLIAFIVLGPKDIAKTGRTVGKFLRKVVTSQWWNGFRHASLEISQLPYTLMREASIEEASQALKDIETSGNKLPSNNPSISPTDFKSWTNPVLSTPNYHDSHRVMKVEATQEDNQTSPPGE